jgi:eukaryotic-like serine/threonine-protein kinase
MVESVVDASEVVMEEELLFDDPPREQFVRRDELVREGEVLAGKYRVERIPGRNGLGVLVQVRHMELGQEVTLKFLVPDACMYPEFVQRFIREARAAVKIQGEHVARVTDVGRLASGAPYMVREFLRGPDLSEVLKVRGPLPVIEACDYIIQAAEAVAEAHALGIAHRNLRPTTLVVTRRTDGAPLVKVFDFAAAEALHVEPFTKQSVSLVGSSALLASLPYLSPEQVRDPQGVDFRADVYGLGAILYELLSGIPPFEAESAPALLAMVAADLPVRLRTLRFGLPAPLEEAVMRALEKSRELRFSTVAELALALKPFASAESTGSIERIVRLSRRGTRPPPVADARISQPSIPVAAPIGFDDQPTTISAMQFEWPLRNTLPIGYVSAPQDYSTAPQDSHEPVEPQTQAFRAARTNISAAPIAEASITAQPASPRVSPPPPLQVERRSTSVPPPLHVAATPKVERRAISAPAPKPAPVAEPAPVVPSAQREPSQPPPLRASSEAAPNPSAINTTMMPPPVTRHRSSISWGTSNSWGPPEPEKPKLAMKRLVALAGAGACVAILGLVAIRAGFQGHAAAAQPVAAKVAPPPPAPPPPPPVVEPPPPVASEAPVAPASAPAPAPSAAPVAAKAAPPVAAAPPHPAPAARPAPAAAPVAVKPAAPRPVTEDAPRAPAKVATATPSKAKDLFSDPE